MTKWTVEQSFNWDRSAGPFRSMRHAAGTIGWRIFRDVILASLQTDLLRNNWLRYERDCIRRLPKYFFSANQDVDSTSGSDSDTFETVSTLLCPELFPDLLWVAAWPMGADVWNDCINGHSFRGEEGVTFFDHMTNN